MTSCTESVVEDATLTGLGGMGYAELSGPDSAAGERGANRRDPSYREDFLKASYAERQCLGCLGDE
ncbi:MAG: hypothetical protein ACKVX7_05490 [Planctomycetota bacterium]